MLHFVKYMFFFTLFFASLDSFSVNSSTIEQQANARINELYHSIKSIPNNSSMAVRLNWFSKQFIDAIYVLGSLGEGANSRYDQYPLYRIDAFDCDTFVNTVLALALADSLSTFQRCINNLRYKDGTVAYETRAHFTSIDWNEYHQQQGIFKDITNSIRNENKQSVTQYATVVIDKASWYAHKTLSTIRINNTDKEIQEQRLAELKANSSHLESKKSKVAYLPLSALFPKPDEPNLHLFSQIPDGAIIEIVRPDWDLRKEIGTYLDISHLGFAFWEHNILYFREASSQYKKVVDVPLIDYLAKVINSSTIKGINVQILLPRSTGLCR